MLYIFMGQSCTGKSTAASKLKESIQANVFAGKDYLRLAKTEAEAWRVFQKALSEAVSGSTNMIYVVTEIQQLERLGAIKGARRIKFTAQLETIKARFAQRMNGKLPQPVEKMLERQYAEWENVKGDLHLDTTHNPDPAELVTAILSH